MSGNIVFGVKLVGDSRELTGEVAVARNAVKSLGDTAQKVSQTSTASAKAMADGYKQAGISAAQMQAALRGVPAQFTDIATSLASGQAPLTVLMQQGGQLKDMFGGIGPAARALGGYVAGLVNPFTLAAAAAGALGYAYYKGSKEADAFRMAVVMTGGAAGATIGQLDAMAGSVAALNSATKGLAADALAQVVATGAVAAESLQSVATAAINVERYGGVAIADTVKQFEELARKPVDASLKLNEQYHHLTAAIYDQIKALADQGRASDAANLAVKTYADALSSRTEEIKQNLGTIETAWRGVADMAKFAWDSMLGVGRKTTDEERIAELIQKAAPGRGIFAGRSKEEDAELAALQQKVAAEHEATQAKAKQVKLNDQTIEFYREVDKYQSKQAQKSRELAQLETLYQAARELAGGDRTKLDAEAARYKAAKSGIEEKFKEPRKARSDAPDFDLTRLGNEFETAVRHGDDLLSDLRVKAAKSLDPFAAAETEFAERFGKRIAEAREKGVVSLGELAEAEAAARKAAADKAAEQASAPRRALERDYRKEAEARQRAQAAETMTESQRQLADALAAVDDRARAAREALDMKFPEGTREAQAYKAELAKIDAAHADAARSARAVATQQDALNASWEQGAAVALRNYLDQVKNVARQSEQAFSRSFQRMEDALTNFVTTGKFDFKSLIDSMIAELARFVVQQQVMKPLLEGMKGGSGGAGSGLLGWIGGLFNGGGSSRAALEEAASLFSWNAKGGVYSSPDLHQYANTILSSPTLFKFAKGGAFGVGGEAGPEAIMPLSRGPSGDLGVRLFGANAGANGIQVQIFDQRSTATASPVQTEIGTGPDGMNQLRVFIKDEVNSQIATGRHDAVMRGRYGVGPRVMSRG